MNEPKQHSNIAYGYLIFALWPIMGLFIAIRNIGHRYARSIVVLFFGLFGLNLVYDETADSTRHAESFQRISEKPFSEFFNIVTGLYSEEGQKPDFLMDFVAFVISRLTTNSSIFFLTIGLLLGWIFVKNIHVYYNLYDRNRNAIGLIFLLFFVVLLPPMRILSFRHYFALLVFIYGIYKYFTDGGRMYLYILTSCVFVHYGFLMIVPLFYLYKFVGNRNFIFYGIIVLSFVLASQTTDVIRDMGVFFEGGAQSAIRGYTHGKYLDKVSGLQENRNFILNSYTRWTTLFMLGAMLFHKFRYRNFDVVSERLYSFSLVMFAFVNFTVAIESITNRFSMVYQALCCIFFIHLYAKNNLPENRIFKVVSIVFLILNGVILLRLTIQYLNFVNVVPFLPIAIFEDSNVSVLDVLK